MNMQRWAVVFLLAVIVSSMGVIVAKSRSNGYIRHELWVESDDDRTVRPPATWTSVGWNVRLAGMRVYNHLPRLPKKEMKVTDMAWQVIDPGDPAFAGVYSQVSGETYNGKAVHRLGGIADGKALWWNTNSGGAWALDPTPGGDWPPYTGSGADLPANPWGGSGTAPAPTLAEYVSPVGTPVAGTVNPYSASYDTFEWPSAGGVFGATSPIAPGIVTISATDYVCFCSPNVTANALLLYDLATHDWTPITPAAAPLANWDVHQSGGVFDAGDGVNAHLFSGGYVRAGSPYFTFLPIDLTTGIPGTAVEVPLNAATITNAVQLADGTLRICEREGAGEGSLRLLDYTPGNAAVSEVVAWASGAWPGMPVGWTEGKPALNPDHALYLASNGDLFYMRRGNFGTVPYQIMGSSIERLPTIGVNNSMEYQTWGEYAYAPGVLIGSSGSSAGAAAETFKWEPGGVAVAAHSYVSWPAGRYWFLQHGTALLVAGWGAGGASGLPFVSYITPATVAPAFASSTAAAYAPTIAKAVAPAFASSAATAYAPTIVKKRIVAPAFAQSTAIAYAPQIIGHADRTPAPSSGEWGRIRVRVI